MFDNNDAEAQYQLAISLDQAEQYAEAIKHYRLAAEQGYAKAQYELGNVYGYGRKDETLELADWLSSQTVRALERANKATPKQKRALLFSAVLMTQNWESLLILPLTCDKELSAKRLGGWNINNAEDAIYTLDYLCVADNHTQKVDNKYKLIKLHTVESKNTDFSTASQMLMRFGYTEDELLSLSTLAAWDYGRLGFIARHSWDVGYIDKVTAWDYMLRCADNAARHYDSWREYLAAYVLGRALWGSDCKDIEHELAYLLCHPNSPFKRGIAIKQGYNDTNFDFHYDYCNIEIDHVEAVRWWTKAAEQGSAEAQHNLAIAYYNGKGVPEDMERAYYWMKTATEQGCKEAKNNFEQLCDETWIKNLLAAQAGDAKAQSRLGSCYKHGMGVPEDINKALMWWRKAAEQGEAVAQYELGVCYDDEIGVEQDYEEAVKWYRLAAEQGDVDAQDRLGYCYDEGNGVAQDYEEAVFWYRLAADQDSAYAMGKLGYCYDYGNGVPKDMDEAIYWYKKAAEGGDQDAQNNLAYSYAHGEGVDKDIGLAIHWYSLAAEQGSEEAQYSLGSAYESGEGVEKDMDLAFHWYSEAAAQGHEAAQTALNELLADGYGQEQLRNLFQFDNIDEV
jgi:TPR repeat protein